MTFRTNETVYCRFTGQAFDILACDGVLASLRFAGSDETSTRPVGELTRLAPGHVEGALAGIIEALGGPLA